MFSVEGSSGKARNSLRSTRRRPRNSDGPQQGRRKRSKLGDDTFVAVDAQPNGNGSLVMNGHATGVDDSSSMLMDIPVREKKKGQPKRALNEDSATWLTRSPNYEVQKLPSFPVQLSNGPTPFRASALPSAGLALALTAENALVWEYSSPSGSNKAHAIPLPPSLAGADPLPLGAIVRNGPANDFGVIAVAPATGRIVFWENVDSAEARGHFVQRHQGVEGSIKLYSGETITDLVDIEHAGYILVLSSGRLAQLTLRDTQGRPSIVTTVMSVPNGSGGSFFSFRGLLGGAIRKTIASVKARPSESKGQMEIITATKNGTFQVWDLSWSGQQNFKREFDANNAALIAMQQGSAPEIRGQQEAHMLDFAIMRQQSRGRGLSLLALAALSGRETLDYFLLELDLSEQGATVSRAIPLRNFDQPVLPKEPTGTLFLPGKGDLALVQFPTAVVVAALDEVEESPETQLITDSGSPLLPFQDSIYFREDANVHIVGHALEDHATTKTRCSIVLFIQDYGTLQINARPRPKGSTSEEKRQRVTAYDKLSQASLFSTVPGNILDFRSRYSYAPEEVEEAALRLGHSTLGATFDHLGRSTTSIDELLVTRALVLFTLIKYLRSDYEPLSFSLKWELLGHAEKLHAATKLWKWYQNKLRDKEVHPEAYPQKLLLKNLVISLDEKFKTPMDEKEPDRVRHFFLNDIINIGVLIPWGWTNLRVLYIDRGARDGPSVMQHLSEANDIMLVTLENALSFRQFNAERYGIDPSHLEDGVLKEGHGYDLLPYIWSSSHNMINSLRSLIDCSRTVADDAYEQDSQDEQAQKIGKDTPRLVRMCCQTHIERFRWALEQSDEKDREMGRKLREEWDTKVRPPQIYGLMEIGLATEGMNLAEKYRDMPTLAKLIWDECEYLEQNKETAHSKIELAEIGVKLNRIKDRINRYFQEHGKDFADAFFRKYIAENRARSLFELKGSWDPMVLTDFLAEESSRSKLLWIERAMHRDFTTAGLALAKAGMRHETNSWCQRVELSMSKLALMCKEEAKQDTTEQNEPQLKEDELNRVKRIGKKVDVVLELSKIRDMVYERLLPTINGALDDNAAISLLMSEFGHGRLDARPALQGLLRQGFDEMIHHRVMDHSLMIDLLTLMNYDEPTDLTDPIQSNEFAYALRTLTLSWNDLHRTTRVGLRGLIWKRLFLKDNWEYINHGYEVSDTTLYEFLLHTNLGWAVKQLFGMIDVDKRYDIAWFESFDELSGKGCTDGEFCIRFANEEIRKPIIEENKLDEVEYETLVKEHNLEKWFAACVRAAKWAIHGGGDEILAAEAEDVEVDGNGAVIGEDEVQESVEIGYAEGVDEEGADADVEMTDS